MRRGQSRQDQGTPPEFIAAVTNRFGRISFDLAAHQRNAVVPQFYDRKDNSLIQPWHKLRGNLWLNPEFDDIEPWAMKCEYEARMGAKILFLTPASVGSNWYRDNIHGKAMVLFLNGRITFVGSDDPYVKDCMLTMFGYGRIGHDVWQWKQGNSYQQAV